MKEKLNQFVSNLNGQFVEVSYKPALYQCMDLAYVWTFVLGFPKSTIQHEFAYEVYTQASEITRQYFDIIPNTPDAIPQDGDLVIFNKTSGNVAGHIGIALGGGSTKNFMMFEQNSPTGTNSNIKQKSYTNCLGFLRPKSVVSGDTPQWLLTLLQERGLKIENESEIRVLFDKAKRYDDELKELREQVKSSNESLSDKSLEVASLTGKLQKSESRTEELEKLYNDAKIERDNFEYENRQLKLANDEFQKVIEENKVQLNDQMLTIKELQGQKVEDLKPSELILMGISKWFKEVTKK